MSRKHLCLTFFDDLEVIAQRLRDLPMKSGSNARYCVWQWEVTPTTGKKHIQAYVEFSENVGAARFKELIGSQSVHVENRRGTRDDARKYCRKDETRVPGTVSEESGVWSTGSGDRTDIRALVQRVRAGVSDIELIDDMPEFYMRNYRAIRDLRLTLIPPRTEMPKVTYIYGDPEAGKSRKAWELARGVNSRVYAWNLTKWWDGYTGQPCVVTGDVTTKIWKEPLGIQYMLDLLDRYPFRIEGKNTSFEVNSTDFFLTSNLSPTELTAELGPKHVVAFWRRFSKIYYMKIQDNGDVHTVDMTAEYVPVRLTGIE